jgi:DNA-binding LacI/PurR family transcriptional regulator
MGRLAVQLLIERAESAATNCTTASLRPTLVERQSVRSIRGS